MPNERPTQEEIAELAYQYWQERGDGEGSAESDWLQAEQDLQIAELAEENATDPVR